MTVPGSDAGDGGPPPSPLASPLAWLRPIDSEHSAIWQCLAGEAMSGVARLILTASGGPFIDATPVRAEGIKISWVELQPSARHEKRARHPTWGKSDDALACRESFLDQGSVRHK